MLVRPCWPMRPATSGSATPKPGSRRFLHLPRQKSAATAGNSEADRNTFFFSDRPGSVYAWTILGLQHLVADGPDFDQYRLGKLFPVEGVAGPVEGAAGQNPGGAIATTVIWSSENHRDGGNACLYLIKLPTAEKKPSP